MAGQIRMSPEQMRSRATEYSKQAGNLQSIITKMDNLLKQLQSEWEGESSKAYADKFTELRPGFVKAKDLIEDIARALKASAQIVEETDEKIAKEMKK